MKKRTKLLLVLQSIAFMLLLAVCVLTSARVVERKASRIKYEPFYEAPQMYDVLFVGDSHMINAVYPMELWRDYGIASYNVACIGNTLPVSYWTLTSALDEAQPELVVIDVNDVEFAHKLTGSSSDAHTALDGLPMNRTKIRAIEDLMDDPWVTDDDGTPYTDLKWEYYFTLGKYHTRWSEVNAGDFAPELNVQKGAQMAVGVAQPRNYDIIDENMALEESGWGFAYLRAMVEECQSRGIEVMLVHLPYPSTEEDQMAANAVYWIAEDYGVPYVDFVALDQVVDYRADCCDSFSHLNPSGAHKVTDYLGRFITEHYGMADRRSDPAYESWAEDYAAYKAYKIGHINMQHGLPATLALLHDTSFSVRIGVRPGAALYGDEQLMRLVHNIPREHIFEEDAYAMWSDGLFPLAGLDEAAAQDAAYFAHIGGSQRLTQEWTGDAAVAQIEAVFGGRDAQVSLEVIDEATGDTVATLHF